MCVCGGGGVEYLHSISTQNVFSVIGEGCGTPRSKNSTKEDTTGFVGELFGDLNVFRRAVPGVRAFIRRFYDATFRVKQPHHFVRINVGIREDIEMFLRDFNGKRYFQNSSWYHSDVLQVFFIDIAGKSQLGCGACLRGTVVFPRHRYPTISDITADRPNV